ncbi:MalY/PatB family protein [Ferrimonas lipolytica]|uniref:cysteine-S-conjugate beta-lyase n=1 Tax=Ferrimonas lipolytica TaxID=2724191 RepID=A0A6H1UBF7_9GAMM|nr:PatB family C-S lyase [Ferrimonas lipolytica]QIZ76374.1 putative C-S lyase [Ferrimonas lipolytica]
MQYDFQQHIDRRHGDSIKWNRYGDEDVIPMWVADMDFAIAPAIKQALADRVDHGVFGYAHVDAQLVHAAIAWFAKRWDWHIDPSWLVAIPAVVPGLNYAVQALDNPGKITWPNPVYGPIAKVASHLNLGGGTFGVDADGWDLQQLEQQLQAGARTVMLCCPQNPIGRCFSQDDYQALAELIERFDAYVVSDDIHGDLMLDGQQHLPLIKACPQIAERVLTLVAGGKAFNIAGLPFAFAVVPNRHWRKSLQDKLSGFAPSPCVAAMTALKAAWLHGEAWLDQLLTVLTENRDYLMSTLADLPEIEVIRPEATYLAWIDCRKLNWSKPAQHLRRFGLGVSDGTEFAKPGFVRINFGCPKETLAQGLARFRLAVEASR